MTSSPASAIRCGIEMIVAISYHQGDKPLMERWASHVKKLGNYKKHKIVLLPVRGASTDGIKEVLETCFGEVMVEPCNHPQAGWPISCNMAFEAMAWMAYLNLKQPFLWMEPDAVPIQPQWIDSIELAYSHCGQKFMGDFVEIEGVMPNGVNHMSGIAVYHWDLPSIAPSIFNNWNVAWDIASAKHVVGKMARTHLIQHDWVPTKQWRRDKVDISCVNPLAVIYHPDKLGVLFNDGLSPNGTQGDPAAGVPCEGSPHETKDQPEKVEWMNPNESKEDVIFSLIQAVVNHAKQSRRNKKEVIERLQQEGIIPKAKGAKQSRKKVRSAMGRSKGAGASDRVQVPSSQEVEG